MKIIFHQAWIKAFRRKGNSSPEKVSAVRIGGFCIMAALIMMFSSINTESTQGSARYYQTNTNDLVITQTGSHSNVESSTVSSEVMRSLERLDGIEVAGITNYFGKLKGRDVLYAMYEPGQPTQPLIADGRHIASDSEVVIDEDLASSQDISLGDTVRLVDHDYTVVGLSRETGSFGKEMVFISNAAMFSLYGGFEFYNQIAVETHGNTIPPETINSWGDSVEIISQQEYIDGIVDYWSRNISPLIFTIIEIVTLMSIVSLIVLLIAQLKLQLPILGIYRAYGGSRLQVGAIEGLAMAMLAALGYILALPLGWILILANNYTTPGFHASLSANALIFAGAVVVGVASISVVIVWWRSSKASPMELLRN